MLAEGSEFDVEGASGSRNADVLPEALSRRDPLHHAVTRFHHRRRRPANEMQQCHDVDLEHGGAGSGTNAGHQRNLFGHARVSWEWAARRSRTKSSRSLPKNISLSTKKQGTPNTPLCAARALRRWRFARRSVDSARRQKCGTSIPSLFRSVSRPSSVTMS